MTFDKHTAGRFEKFKGIERTDGQSAPGQKHHGCDYFVLDLTHDPHAMPAIKAYAASCRADYPQLAADLDPFGTAEAVSVAAAQDTVARFQAWLLRDEAAKEQRIGDSYVDTAPDVASAHQVLAKALRAGAEALEPLVKP